MRRPWVLLTERFDIAHATLVKKNDYSERSESKVEIVSGGVFRYVLQC